MKVLIHGASNVIAIGTARVLRLAGHHVVLSDTNRFARAFFSKYCKKRYVFKDPLTDRSGFATGLVNCIDQEEIEFIVPTTGQSLLQLAEAKDTLSADITFPFPLDAARIRYVSNKGNLPEICMAAGVRTPLTCAAKDYRNADDWPRMAAPVAVKRTNGLAGEGFVKVASLRNLDRVLAKAEQKFSGDDLLVQEYIDGKIYGAGGIFDGQQLQKFYAYEYVKRYPPGRGTPTMCRQYDSPSIKAAMVKILSALQWHGYCQMDFIVERKSEELYLVDINPVHWYTLPFSSALGLNSLFYYLGKSSQCHSEDGGYTTICLSREMQRILFSGFRCEPLDNGNGFLRQLKGVRSVDFFWDPLPIMLVPVLRFLRFAQRWCR